jgi:hypothetical protein
VGGDARRALLGELIDYAGLFPPAQLPMEQALAGYREARAGAHAWMLHRFVCPTARLSELGAEASWPITVTAKPSELEAIVAYDGPLRLDAVEVRLSPEADADEVARIAESSLPRCFVEVPLGAGMDELLDALADARLAAKVRCGGAVAAPEPAALAGFIAGCSARDLEWKATAGLHHPLRHQDTASGEWEHGFLNVLAAAGVAAAGADTSEVEEVLACADADAFALDATGLRWRGRALGPEARRRFDGYGSCSFDEPVKDLIGLGILEPEAVHDG